MQNQLEKEQKKKLQLDDYKNLFRSTFDRVSFTNTLTSTQKAQGRLIHLAAFRRPNRGIFNKKHHRSLARVTTKIKFDQID